MKFDNLIGDNNEWLEKQKQVNEYLQPALELYFQNAGIKCFRGGVGMSYAIEITDLKKK